MNARLLRVFCGFLFLLPAGACACCAVARFGEPVVNADQTVLVIWDPATKTEHFIRKASFEAKGGDFGFLVPTPTRPELSESGAAAFPALASFTRPLVRPRSGSGCSCNGSLGVTPECSPAPRVVVHERKEVAGFDAAVLSASTPKDLGEWLNANGFEFSPEAEVWAAPYVRDGWMLTALRLKKSEETKDEKRMAADALRISFHTERPLFPYREPDSRTAAQMLGITGRMLRIYFISNARFEGKLDGSNGWTGRPVWSNLVSDFQKAALLELLKLPAASGPAEWWLTEFEDHWAYGVAPGDLYFAVAEKQEPLVRWVGGAPGGEKDVSIAVGLVLVGFGLWWRRRITAKLKPSKPAP